MTDLARHSGRAIALTLVPVGAAVLGAGLAWAENHDPQTATQPEPAVTVTVTAQPDLSALQAQIDEAKARLVVLADEAAAQDAATASTGSSSGSSSGGATTGSNTSGGQNPAPAAPAPAPPAPAPAPPVDTGTGGS